MSHDDAVYCYIQYSAIGWLAFLPKLMRWAVDDGDRTPEPIALSCTEEKQIQSSRELRSESRREREQKRAGFRIFFNHLNKPKHVPSQSTASLPTFPAIEKCSVSCTCDGQGRSPKQSWN